MYSFRSANHHRLVLQPECVLMRMSFMPTMLNSGSVLPSSPHSKQEQQKLPSRAPLSTMLTAPRQRVRGTPGNANGDANSRQSSSPPQNRPFSRRRRQKQSHLLWEISGATLLLVMLVLLAPRSQQPRQPQAKPNNRDNFNNNTIETFSQPEEVVITEKPSSSRPSLTAFLEPPDTLQTQIRPLPQRTTVSSHLTKIEYPQVQECSRLSETFPIDNYPTDDPYLPWIHDVFPTADGKHVKVVAQNRRRCDTGLDHGEAMKYWEPQIALFQPVPVKIMDDGGKTRFRLATSLDEADVQETRFLCRFHSGDVEETTLSEYPFNYEYVTWRKNKSSMFAKAGKDSAQFWLSQFYFSCPVPDLFQDKIRTGSHVTNDVSDLFVDVVPIRTPARDGTFLFTPDHIGAENMASTRIFYPSKEWGASHVLPDVVDSGRWANIPVCLPPVPPQQRHRAVACTWTAASYTRRGDAVKLSDTADRLREWIAFHSLVGFDHLYVYDNSVLDGAATSVIEQITNEFPNLVTYHRWPCQICNNNRPAHRNPGERSSQYAAEASCRDRYGPYTDWMAFIDTDEYLVPMKGDTWSTILDDMENNNIKVLKMRSSRAKPRVELMEPMEDQSQCVDKKPPRSTTEKPDPCVVPRKDQTFLRVYNCEFIKPPRPDRFERAMKQLYRTDYVLSHFVHYSTVTKDVSRLRKDHEPTEHYIRAAQSFEFKRMIPEMFLDEIHEGTLIHTRSVLPIETTRRTAECYNSSKFACMMGYQCPDSVEFSDELHKDNIFHDEDGNYCNCWINHRVEDFFVPKLEAALNKDR